jgi:hypothetical protein
MAVTISVFRRKGLKRGSPVTNAVFIQLFQQHKLAPGFPGATVPVPLPVISQTSNTYVLNPATSAPLPKPEDFFGGPPFTIRITVPLTSGGPEDSSDISINQGGSVEAWVGYER